MISISDRIVFLEKIHLFHDLDEMELTRIANLLDELVFSADEIILQQNATGNSFYLIYRGKVRILRKRENADQKLALLVPGDYFGEIPFGQLQPRSTTAISTEETLAFRLSLQDLKNIVGQIASLKSNLELSIKSRKLARRLQLKWLHPDEAIYFITRKHPIILFQRLAFPLTGFVIFSFLIILAFVYSAIILASSGVLVLLLLLLWALWQVVDWGNDYYIITNQRIVWLEKVIGIYDSRQEAPISSILSVGVETDLLGRELGYGDIVVRTYVGRIVMQQASHPYLAARVVEELWIRFKEIIQRSEIEKTKQMLRERLGLTPLEGNKEVVKSVDATDTFSPSQPKLKPWQILFGRAEWFRTRIEKHGTITYRKHLFVLFRQTWMPGLLLFVGSIYLVYRTLFLFTNPTTIENLYTLILVLFLVPVFLWWLYQYVDWGNDIFQITPNQVVDIDRTPLGTEQRRSAPLGNILSTESRRVGPLGQIFNYGTVYISVGNIQLTFDEVANPVAIQQEIDRRRLARIAEENKAQEEAERERILDWLITYHKNTQELSRNQEQ